MFRRDFMPCTYNAALEQAESRFHSVCMHVAVRVLTGMVDSLVKVLLHLIECPRVDSRFIRHNHFHMASNVCIDHFADSLGLGIFGTDEPQIAIALPDA